MRVTHASPEMVRNGDRNAGCTSSNIGSKPVVYVSRPARTVVHHRFDDRSINRPMVAPSPRPPPLPHKETALECGPVPPPGPAPWPGDARRGAQPAGTAAPARGGTGLLRHLDLPP